MALGMLRLLKTLELSLPRATDALATHASASGSRAPVGVKMDPKYLTLRAKVMGPWVVTTQLP